jgi:hypothetical protein
VITPYLRNLQNNGAAASYSGGIRDMYDDASIREAYVDAAIDRFRVRLGKQIISWGDTDFFTGNDLVNGSDYRWRTFLEPAQDLKKALVMANVTLDVPEVKGALQLLYRPGKLNRESDIGNTYDVSGGRWANQPYRGTDFLTITPYNYRNPSGDADRDTYGLRWSGLTGAVNYSVMALQTYSPDPVENPAWNPFQGHLPVGGVPAELTFPRMNVYGTNVSGYSSLADAVFSAEVAYLNKYAFNYGYVNPFSLPGFSGIIQKNVVRTTIRMDKNMGGIASVLGAEKPAFFSLQIFDNWIQKFDANEQIVNLVGEGRARKSHSTLFTQILALSYDNGRVQPSVAAGEDLSYGGGFVVPAVTFEFGKSWRLKTELDLFWNRGSRNPGNAATERETALFGYFRNNNQWYTSLTYQF